MSGTCRPWLGSLDYNHKRATPDVFHFDFSECFCRESYVDVYIRSSNSSSSSRVFHEKSAAHLEYLAYSTAAIVLFNAVFMLMFQVNQKSKAQFCHVHLFNYIYTQINCRRISSSLHDSSSKR